MRIDAPESFWIFVVSLLLLPVAGLIYQLICRLFLS